MTRQNSPMLAPLYSRCLVLVSLATWAKADPIHMPTSSAIVTTTNTATTGSTLSPNWLAVNETDPGRLISSHPFISANSTKDSASPGFGQSRLRQNPSWRRKRRFAEADRESLPGQDPRCDDFIHSVEVVQPRDPSVMTDFFGVSATQKRVKEYQFHTPNWPKPFPYEIDCIKIISAPTKHHRILLNFRGVFELEPEPNCLGDFLEVRDGAFGFSPLLGRFCSRRVPNVGNGIQTSGQYMWLRFRSDSTISHRGFQAVYRFYETSFDTPPDHVFRFRHRMDMQAGETWKLNQDFLLQNLHDYSQDLRHLPIEAAFDIRSPNDTSIVIFVNQVKVPQSFSWTCDPDQLLAENPRFRCLKTTPMLFGPKSDRRPASDLNVRLNKIAMQDPSSIIDGRHTRFEVYEQWSISPYSPPCPKVRQFCDDTVGLPGLEKTQEWQRHFHFNHSRAVIRILLPSILEEPPKKNLTRRRRALSRGSQEKGVANRQITLPYLEQMPEFEFQITILSRTVPPESSTCEENWVACDKYTCIPQQLWCDNISNCPQRQDEGQHCTIFALDPDAIGPDGRRLADQGKSSYELRKEQEAQEAAAARLAAQKLHLSILGSLGLILTIVTVTCVVMAIRRRKRGQIRVQASKPTSTPAPVETKPVRLNHIMSTGALSDKPTTPLSSSERRREGRTRPVFTLAKSNSIPEQDGMVAQTRTKDLTSTGVSETVWNSTDSMNAPLLWHKPNVSATGKSKTRANHHAPSVTGNQWNQTVPAELVFHDTGEHRPSVEREIRTPKLSRSPHKQSSRFVRSAAVAPMPGPSPSHSTRLGPAMGSSSGRSGVGRTTVAPYPPQTSEMHKKMAAHGSPRDEGQWVSGTRANLIGSTSPEGAQAARKFRADSKPVSQLRASKADTKLPYQSSADQHWPSCRLISRTQSWGGGLRLAGTEPFCNGEWEVTHSTDGNDQPDFQTPNGSVYRKTSVNSQNRTTDDRWGLRPTESGRPARGVPIYRCRDMEAPAVITVPGLKHPTQQRTTIHVSMPNVNGAFTHRSPTAVQPTWEDRPAIRLRAIPTKRDFKPPSAKRPRIAANQPEPRDSGQWIATSYGTDTEDDFSAGAVMLEECVSIPSDSMKPPSAGTSSISANTNTSQAMMAELAALRSLKNEVNSRLLLQASGPRRQDGTSAHPTTYSPNGVRGFPIMDSPRTSSVSNVSTEEGSTEPSNGQGIEQSESEGFYHTSKVSQQEYSSDSEGSTPNVMAFPGTELPVDPISVQYRPMVRRIGVGSSLLEPAQPTGTPVYRSITDTGRPVIHHPRTPRIPSGSSVDREPVESYVYEYEA